MNNYIYIGLLCIGTYYLSTYIFNHYNPIIGTTIGIGGLILILNLLEKHLSNKK